MPSANNTPAVLWISAHPEPSSLNGSLRADALDHLRRTGHAVLESDLHAMGWDPVVRPRDGAHQADASQPFRVSTDTRAAHLAGTQPIDVSASMWSIHTGGVDMER
ncbi:NAD(P)H-dependent oxidoreductase [Propionibacteriaceae bacterium Y1700]|uniref:NAD(P)H-dependent oxidoreductase n=1 Tax=Microlunatus sp. Y1700 TaxID=3418487 RepID=UPI003DA74E64